MLVVIFFSMIAVAIVAVTQFDVHYRNDRLLLMAYAAMPVLIGSGVCYYFGGYRLKE
jgi:hypothetical protein